MAKNDPTRFADFTKANQRKLSPQDRVKAQTEKHPDDQTPAPQPEAEEKRDSKRRTDAAPGK